MVEEQLNRGEQIEKIVKWGEDEVWDVKRVGRIDEVHFISGRIQWRVKIWDSGRHAFITEWFNDPSPALDFRERVKLENERESRNA